MLGITLHYRNSPTDNPGTKNLRYSPENILPLFLLLMVLAGAGPLFPHPIPPPDGA